MHAGADRQTNLAAERTTFVGRTSELAAVASLLRRGERLVTLTGPGGAGKSRLARELGRALRPEYPGGAFACDLSTATSADDLSSAVAVAVGRSLDPAVALGEQVSRWLGGRGRCLLVLDSGERLDAGARSQVRAWLDGASSLVVLATSREVLGLAGEREAPLPAMTSDDAARLFVERGKAWDARLEGAEALPSVRDVVERMERLPLALELAAARLDLFTPAELLARLDAAGIGASVSERGGRAPTSRPFLDALGPARPGVLARHATLRATIGWSWALLSDDEQRLAGQLSAFHGGFSLAAVRALAPDPDRQEHHLSALRRKSLVIPCDGPAGDGRFALFESVRAFAAEQLDVSGRRLEAEAAHARVVLAQVRPLLAELEGPRDAEAMARLGAEQENLLAIDERGERVGALAAAEALLALQPLVVSRGPAELLRPRLERRLASLGMAPGAAPDLVKLRWRLTLARGEALRLRGLLDAAASDFDAVRAWAEPAGALALASEAGRQWALLEGARGQPREAVRRSLAALKLARRAGARPLEAQCLGALGAAQQSLGRLRRAVGAHARALTVLRAVGAQRLVGVELSFLAVATHRLGHFAEAEGLHLEALAIDRQLGHRRFEGAELTHLGYLHHERGALEASRASFEAGLRIFREMGDVALEAVALTFLGRLGVEARSSDARLRLDEALALHRGSGHARLEATTLTCLGHLCRDAGDDAGARDHYHRALERSLDVEVGFEALAPAWLGEVERRLGDPGAARRFDSALERTGRHQNPVYRAVAELLAGSSTARPERLRALASSSSELRRALRLSGARLPAPESTSLVLAADGAWLRRDGGAPVDLARRKAVRLVLLALARARLEQPGVALTWQQLLAAGWPGEQPVNDSGLKRVYTAVWTLRGLGLEGLLLTRGDGYLLDAQVPVSWA